MFHNLDKRQHTLTLHYKRNTTKKIEFTITIQNHSIVAYCRIARAVGMWR